MFVGDSEIIQPISNHHSKLNRPSRIVKYYGFMTLILNNLFNSCNNLISRRRGPHSHNILIVFMKNVERKMETFLTKFSKTHKCKHHLCAHRYNCFIYAAVVMNELLEKIIYESRKNIFSNFLLEIN